MKLRLGIVVTIFSVSCLGQGTLNSIQKFCELGGQKVITQGLNSTNEAQQSFPQCQVTVYLTGTSNKANIFRDNLGPPTPLANPFTANTNASFLFYVANGCYDIVTAGGNIGDQFPSPFTYTDVCVGTGGSGGGIGPGTINQVAKFVATNNVGNSSGGPDDGVNPVPWVNGLSVNNSGYNKQRPNGTNCTTANLLVEYDGNTVGGKSSVQTAVASSQKVIGVAGQGAGCTGTVQVIDHAFGPCIFDGQTIIGDGVVASATPGQCSDSPTQIPGVKTIGTVASLNTGAGTLAVVDWFTGDKIGAGAQGGITQCATGGSNAYYPGIGQVISCDPLVLDDGSGHLNLKGARFTDSSTGGWWDQIQGPLPALSDLNAVYFSPGASISATYGIQPFASKPTVGDCIDLAAGDATNWVKLHDSGSPCGGGGSTPIKTCMMVIGADNASSALANADIAPQLEQCQVNTSATVAQINVTADAGTPSVVVAKRHCTANPCASNFTVTDLLSSALATAASGGTACSNTGGTAGYDTFTTCSATLQNTTLAPGDWIETHTATAGGTAKRISIAVHFQ